MPGERESSHCGEKDASVSAAGIAPRRRNGPTHSKENPTSPQECWVVVSLLYRTRLQRGRSSAGLLGRHALAHVAAQLAERVRLDLPDSLRGHAILVSQLV